MGSVTHSLKLTAKARERYWKILKNEWLRDYIVYIYIFSFFGGPSAYFQGQTVQGVRELGFCAYPSYIKLASFAFNLWTIGSSHLGIKIEDWLLQSWLRFFPVSACLFLESQLPTCCFFKHIFVGLPPLYSLDPPKNQTKSTNKIPRKTSQIFCEKPRSFWKTIAPPGSDLSMEVQKRINWSKRCYYTTWLNRKGADGKIGNTWKRYQKTDLSRGNGENISYKKGNNESIETRATWAFVNMGQFNRRQWSSVCWLVNLTLLGHLLMIEINFLYVKGQLYRAYIGISHRGTLVGVHPTIPSIWEFLG